MTSVSTPWDPWGFVRPVESSRSGRRCWSPGREHPLYVENVGFRFREGVFDRLVFMEEEVLGGG